MSANRKESRKELISRYKERKITGGVYTIKNLNTGKFFLHSTTDMRASRNRFDFSKNTGTCTYKNIQEDWTISGPSAFEFEALEELERRDAQTDHEFESDIATLKELWMEKSSSSL